MILTVLPPNPGMARAKSRNAREFGFSFPSPKGSFSFFSMKSVALPMRLPTEYSAMDESVLPANDASVATHGPNMAPIKTVSGSEGTTVKPNKP